MTQVRVIDKNDELYDFVGEVTMIGSERKMWVYFDDVCTTLVYDEHQLEAVETHES